MALKFGSFLDSIFNTSSFNKREGSDVNTGELQDLKDELNEITEILRNQQAAYRKYMRERDELESKLQRAQERSDQRRIDQYTRRIRSLDNDVRELDANLKDVTQAAKEAREAYNKAANEIKRNTQDIADAFEEMFDHKIVDSFAGAMAQLRSDWQKTVQEFQQGNISQKEYVTNMKRTRQEFGKNMFSAIANSDSKGFTSQAGKLLSNGVNKVLTKVIGPTFAGALVAAFTGAVKVGMEYNDLLIDLERQTSGVVSATRLGYNAYGQNEKGTRSLARTLAEANLKTTEFAGALSKYIGVGSSAIGQTIGFSSNLATSADSLQQLGIDLAYYQKNYNADFSNFARNITKNFGATLDDVGKYIKGATLEVRSMGLNVSAFAENLTEASNLVGKYYFKDGIEGQIKLAKAATLAGTSVQQLTRGLEGLNTIQDVFQEQQRAAALGLRNLALNQQRIFALTKTGNPEEAAKLRISSAAKDVVNLGGIQNGQVTARGIDYLKAAKFDEGDIEIIQRYAQASKELNLSMADLFNTVKGQKAFKVWEKGTIKLSERFDNLWVRFQQSFLEPLGRLVLPVLEGLTWALEGLIKPIEWLADAFDWMAGKFTSAGNALGFGGGNGDSLGGVGNIIGAAIPGYLGLKGLSKLSGKGGAMGATGKIASSTLSKGVGAFKFAGRHAGPIGGVLAGLGSGVETYEKTGSAGKGLLVGGATAGGALGGAKLGAMLGAFGGPIGIAIGGTLGAIGGAFFGEEMGKWFAKVDDTNQKLADHQMNRIDEIYDREKENNDKLHNNKPRLNFMPQISMPKIRALDEYTPLVNSTLDPNNLASKQEKVKVEIELKNLAGKDWKVSPNITQQ